MDNLLSETELTDSSYSTWLFLDFNHYAQNSPKQPKRQPYFYVTEPSFSNRMNWLQFSIGSN